MGRPLANEARGDGPPRVRQDEWYGALAQLGERYNGIVEVSGSIPLGSTIQDAA